MTPTSDGWPQVAATARSLGVRIPTDIAPDEAGDVHPGPKGMSVAPDLVSLPLHRIPKRLAHLRQGAIGPDADVVWSFGEGRFIAGPFAAHLALVPDRLDHGVVGPDAKTSLSEYEVALAGTQSGWRRDEK
jgi:hypothetical protein